jgi:hypothetical protein
MPECDSILLSTAYLPNIQYFSKILSHKSIFIEAQENYQKQSYRNRAVILGANGPLDLVIPVIKPEGNHTPTNNILIDYTLPWQQTHWKSIISAYKNSPFFDIFEQELQPLFHRKEKFLLDLNLRILDKILDMAGVQKAYSLTEIYLVQTKDNFYDCRNSIHPKKRLQKPDKQFEPIPYFQVFSEKFGFIPNLSFIDLLFNEGPQAIYICRRCYKN